jgi:xanthine dehydrogenase/oxidase
VYRPSAEAQVYVDITSIDDLTRFKIENDFLVMGANMSLTDAMELFEKLPKRYEKFEYLKNLSKHIDLIANVPVRNVSFLN